MRDVFDTMCCMIQEMSISNGSPFGYVLGSIDGNVICWMGTTKT